MMHQSAPHRIAEPRPIGSLIQIAEKPKAPPQSASLVGFSGAQRALWSGARRRGLSAILKGPPKRDFVLEGRRHGASAHRTVEIFHSQRRHQRGRLTSAPLISTTWWLRGPATTDIKDAQVRGRFDLDALRRPATSGQAGRWRSGSMSPP